MSAGLRHMATDKMGVAVTRGVYQSHTHILAKIMLTGIFPAKIWAWLRFWLILR